MDERHFEMEVENNCVKKIISKSKKKLKLIVEENNYIIINGDKIKIPEGEYEFYGFNILNKN